MFFLGFFLGGRVLVVGPFSGFFWGPGGALRKDFFCFFFGGFFCVVAGVHVSRFCFSFLSRSFWVLFFFFFLGFFVTFLPSGRGVVLSFFSLFFGACFCLFSFIFWFFFVVFSSLWGVFFCVSLLGLFWGPGGL